MDSSTNKLENSSLQIFISSYISEEENFNFNSTDEQKFIFKEWQTNVYEYIYIYLDQDNESIIASFTMDCYNELELLMAVKIQEIGNEIKYTFQTIYDIINKNQYGLYNLKKRMRNINENVFSQQKNLFLNKEEMPSYFYPKIDKQPEMWFALRYMPEMKIQQGMILKIPYICRKQQIAYKQINITKLKLYYDIESVSSGEIKNNDSLNSENQMNLLHICTADPDDQDEEQKNCYSCYEGQQSSSNNISNLLISVCNCSGSNKFIHFDCLIQWIHQEEKNRNKLVCRACKRAYPQYIELTRDFAMNGLGKSTKYFRLLGINKQSRPLIYMNEKVINFRGDEIAIGNASGQGYLIIDIHELNFATIKLDEKKKIATIKDELTDYGVLVKKKQMTFVVDKQDMYKKMVSILMGKRLFAFSLHSK